MMTVLWVTPAELDEPTHPHAEEAARAATWLLYKFTGQRYAGPKTVTEWYGLRGASCWSCGALSEDVLGDTPVTMPHGHTFYSSAPTGLRLRGRPVREVISVETSGGPLASAEYRVANRDVLYRAGGCWNFDSGVTVTYTYGQYPPALGRAAARRLANELVLAADGSSDCELPAGLTSVSRLGLSFSLKDPATLALVGMTGIYEIDLFIAAANPSRALKRPKIFSPDIPRGERYS